MVVGMDFYREELAGTAYRVLIGVVVGILLLFFLRGEFGARLHLGRYRGIADEVGGVHRRNAIRCGFVGKPVVERLLCSRRECTVVGQYRTAIRYDEEREGRQPSISLRVGIPLEWLDTGNVIVRELCAGREEYMKGYEFEIE